MPRALGFADSASMLMRSPGMAQARSTALARSSAPLIDKWSFVPMVAFIYSAIVAQFITYMTSNGEADFGANLLNELAWPAMTAVAIGVAAQNSSRLSRLTWPSHIVWLFVCVAFAVASAAWSVKPAFTVTRCIQLMMLVSSIALTPLLATARSTDMMRTLFYCCALGVVLNTLFGTGSFNGDAASGSGYQGFMSSKNNLGQFAAIAVLMSVYEMTHRGSRRVLGLIFAVLSFMLLVRSSSKTSTALVYLSPALAGLMLALNKTARISAVACLSILMVLCVIFRNDLGQTIFHDPTFTGRTSIWAFVGSEIDRRPLLGWGFLAFWLTGPDSVALVDGAPYGWVARMPHSHNGYVDIVLQLGYVGLACLIMLISTTVLAVERIAKRDRARSWLLLSMIIFIMFNNHLESSFMHGGDFLWVVFVLICADIGQYSLLHQPTSVAQRLNPSSRRAGPGGVRVTRGPIGAKTAITPRHVHAR
jgi:exopolysaccharide production protein ExoQ